MLNSVGLYFLALFFVRRVEICSVAGFGLRVRFNDLTQCICGLDGTKTMTKNKADGLERGSHQSTGGVQGTSTAGLWWLWGAADGWVLLNSFDKYFLFFLSIEKKRLILQFNHLLNGL